MPTRSKDSESTRGQRDLPWWLRLAAPLLAALLLIAVWSVAIQVWQIKSYLLPTPIAVAEQFSSDIRLLSSALSLTTRAALAGLLLSLFAGTAIGTLFAQSALLRCAFFPYAIFLQTVPIVAIAPLLVMWLGYGIRGVIAVAFVLSLFPIITNVTAGMLSVPPPLHGLFQLYGSSRWQRLTKLQFPYTIDHLMTGLKTSSGLSVIGAIVGEFFVGYGGEGVGLGYLIRSSAESYQTARLFAAVILSTVLGVTVFAVVSITAELVVRRWGHQHS